MLNLDASPEGEIHDQRRAVIATASDVRHAHTIVGHAHCRGQLLYAREGNLRVSVKQRQWQLSPGSALWVVSGDEHQIVAAQATRYRCVYVDQSAMRDLPGISGIVNVPPLLRHLIDESAGFGRHYRPDSAEARLNQVIHDQLARLDYATIELQLPSHPLLTPLCESMLRDPARVPSLRAWGHRHGASERHLARLFRAHTGLSFTQWRQRVVVAHAIERLRNGDYVTRIALDLGYASSAAFTHMFRRVTQRRPQDFRISGNSSDPH